MTVALGKGISAVTPPSAAWGEGDMGVQVELQGGNLVSIEGSASTRCPVRVAKMATTMTTVIITPRMGK